MSRVYEYRESGLGLEVSGLDDQGARVMAIVPDGGLATTVRSSFVWPVPEGWSLREAATAPVAYATAYYSLVVRGGMRPGQSVLVHAGSGGVGQAAIALALRADCLVFATAGSREKRSFLKSRFPQLGDHSIGNSRDESFYVMVMTQTNGRGVDLVLNSLAEEKLQASVRCLAENGHFLEIGKFDMYNDKSIGLRVFLKNISFHGINLMKVMSSDQHAREQLRALLSTGMREGVVTPLPSTVFERDQVEEGFRYMATGNHIGKVLIRVSSEIKPTRGLAQPRLAFSPEEYIIVTGGLGGLGQELCGLLVERGARHLVLSSRQRPASALQALRLRRWREAGVEVLVIPAEEDAETLVRRCRGPVVAVFHLAAVLRDGLLESQTANAFAEVWFPKAWLARRLDAATRDLCPGLRFFVAFSSAASGFGNPGQAAYGLASSSVERLVERRVADGLHGLAVQWGPVADVGLAADLPAPGAAHQSVASFLATLEALVSSGRRGVVTSVVAAAAGIPGGGSGDQLLLTLSKILNVTDVRELPPHATLAELGVDSLMQVEIRMGIERHSGLALSHAETRNLTVERILCLAGRALSEVPVEGVSPEQEEARRFVALMQLGGSTTAALPLPRDTTVHLGPAATVPGERRPLFLVHPVDGRADSLRELASSLDRPAVCFQFSHEAPRQSLSRLAAFYIQKLRQLQPTGPYLLGGYSMGVMVAVEMALQLEEVDGARAHLVSLDGLPSMEKLGRPHVLARIEARYLLSAAQTRCPEVDAVSLERELASRDSWGPRLDRCLVALAGRRVSAAELEETRQSLEAFHWRVEACARHERRRGAAICGHVLVVVAEEGLVRAEDDPDSRFSEVSTGRVDVVRVEGGHVSFICGEARCSVVAGHINSWLAALE
ncbi:fatty acid synthase-like [Bacillus rossius redtenbacheri]|uniref:fatty acid synthase-like n=1 Tax=Bacillus rossius redtenbacheri TaxID=93214 RepID=UPI002FDE9089